MKRELGRYRCTLCKLIVSSDVRLDDVMKTMIVQASGQPTVRTVNVDGVEIHRCPITLGPKAHDPNSN